MASWAPSLCSEPEKEPTVRSKHSEVSLCCVFVIHATEDNTTEDNTTQHNNHETADRRRNQDALSQTLRIHRKERRKDDQPGRRTVLLSAHEGSLLLRQRIPREGGHQHIPRQLAARGNLHGQVLQVREVSAARDGPGIPGQVRTLQGVGQAVGGDVLSVRKPRYQAGVGAHDGIDSAVRGCRRLQHEQHRHGVRGGRPIDGALPVAGEFGERRLAPGGHW
mmetsp:Transcript_25275/g.53809  ORF Transcript_25275/g.53809 Transcript_25275/m.53809 type:complete len:221 (-) Transcript_25275:557-1219(-)